MFYIKLTEDKDLEITAREPIYRGEKLNGKLVFLLPETVDELSIEASLVYLSYIRADGHADVVYLDRLEEKYADEYWQFTLPITSKLTRFPGQMNVFLQIFSGDPVDPQIVKSGECCLTVEESPDMDQYFTADRFITALYQHDKRMKDEFERVDGDIAENAEHIGENTEVIAQNADAIRTNTSAIAQINTVLAQHASDIALLSDELADVSAALNGKADGLSFDIDTGVLRLTSGGTPIGNSVTIRMNGKLIDRCDIGDGGELTVYYSDGTSEALGKVVGKDGKIYVPHIDEHNVITWTIEDEPGEIPKPVDLAPGDE